MKGSFDAADFVRRIGRDLVRAFDDAREATTPELVGDAMEQPVRDRLEQILPRGIAVGSGCVIDTKGGTSRQMDVVLYEQGLCPVFCINDSPEATYYPAECVLAVGEVKSTIGKRELADSFEKIRSVKALHRAYTKLETGVYVGQEDRLTRIHHQLPAADADSLALHGRAPSSRFDVLSSTPASSSGPRDQAGRRLE